MKQRNKKQERPTVELVNSRYQPTKAEMNEPIRLDVPGEDILERMGRLARAVSRSVDIKWVDKPKG